MLISNAMAQVAENTAPQAAQGSWMSTLLMVTAFVGLYYFMFLKPQIQTNKKHKELIDNLQKNDIVVCASGIIGKVKKVHSEQIVLVEISDNVIVRVERDKIAEVVDKKHYVKIN